MAPHLAASTFHPPFVGDAIGRLLSGDEHQQPPQAVAIRQIGKPATTGAETEAVEGTEGNVLFVYNAAGVAELLPCQAQEPVAKALPQRCRSLLVARLETFQPAGHRSRRRHVAFP